jgi:signal peptidase I
MAIAINPKLDYVKVEHEGEIYIMAKDCVEEVLGEERFIKEEMKGTFGPYQVPEESLFVMGDNRNNSADSRFPGYVGYVPYDSISGLAFWVYWPITDMRIIDHMTYENI